MRKTACGAVLALGLWHCASTWAQTLTLALPAQQVHAALLRAFASNSDPDSRRRYRLVVPFGTPLFPPDTDFTEPALAAWRQLPPVQRQFDLLLAPDVDYYWKAGNTDFTCQFIIHLHRHTPSSVSLQLFQTQTKIRLGKKFDLLGRTGPGWYWDIRPAPPSAQASADLLAFIRAALAQQQQ
ncbi:hypothetical protein [Janthinobacterium agaricidamnosum]|uniref:hypothetical protein n=1 Tax=Janthinobacterium agaricidamnosum TaxID=55508 RepID=UPI00056F1990|nr:hypothetical protein [Janthinobacterium agaricidamnosum]